MPFSHWIATFSSILRDGKAFMVLILWWLRVETRETQSQAKIKTRRHTITMKMRWRKIIGMKLYKMKWCWCATLHPKNTKTPSTTTKKWAWASYRTMNITECEEKCQLNLIAFCDECFTIMHVYIWSLYSPSFYLFFSLSMIRRWNRNLQRQLKSTTNANKTSNYQPSQSERRELVQEPSEMNKKWNIFCERVLNVYRVGSIGPAPRKGKFYYNIIRETQFS